MQHMLNSGWMNEKSVLKGYVGTENSRTSLWKKFQLFFMEIPLFSNLLQKGSISFHIFAHTKQKVCVRKIIVLRCNLLKKHQPRDNSTLDALAICQKKIAI